MKYKVIAGTIWNAISSSFSFIVSMGTIAVLARLLKPDDFGLFAMITVMVSILESFSDMGVSAAIISYRDVTPVELTSLFYFNILVGVFLTILLILATPIIVYYYKEPRIYLYLWILALNFTITSPATVFNVLLKKNMKFGILSRINMTATVVYSVSAILYACFSRDIMSLVVGTMLQSFVSAGLNVYFGLRIWKPARFVLQYKHIKRFLSFGLYQMGERIINRFNKNIDYLLIGRFLGAAALGYYSVAYTLMMKPIHRINPIITSVAFPALSEVQEDNAQIKKYFLKMIRYICYTAAPIFLLFFALSENLILVFYGNNWLLSVPILAIFSFLGILYSVGNPMGNLVLAKGRADIGFWENLAKTFFLFVANYIGLRWGIYGVACSTLFVTLFLFFPAGFFIRYYLVKMKAPEYLEQLKNPLLFALTAAAVILLLQKYIISLGILGELLLLSGIFVIIYIILLLIFDKQEICFIWKNLKEYASIRKEKVVE
ncbi:MAG: MOP flippase family protein [Candidatus Aminicenantes bacterium]|nr:MOP flippase family protein [Candidatus Aminicenantes bacterium]NIN18111.1 MOP flippase family protein [Candidatus Aminicenantes bacterium]NIN42010.1 MOP flippase family protein [Candidatus Aminicenantes bacterium]NIN84766.1 MOP flippase family protein [Candidatus Aminicenantes bacterium]NIO80922.1 MOP flippase family protein [Candidatus Aminicenantes bacterium]